MVVTIFETEILTCFLEKELEFRNLQEKLENEYKFMLEIFFKNDLFFRSEEKERIDYDDPHISFFWKAHTTSVLIFLILVGFYVGVIEDPNGTNDAEFNSKRFGLSSFQKRDTKLDIILAKNHFSKEINVFCE